MFLFCTGGQLAHNQGNCGTFIGGRISSVNCFRKRRYICSVNGNMSKKMVLYNLSSSDICLECRIC